MSYGCAFYNAKSGGTVYRYAPGVLWRGFDFQRRWQFKEPEILNYIMHDLERGASVINNCVGAYTNNEKKVIISVVDKREAVKLKKKIKQIDPVAFVIVGTSNDIIGDGFKPVE